MHHRAQRGGGGWQQQQQALLPKPILVPTTYYYLLPASHWQKARKKRDSTLTFTLPARTAAIRTFAIFKTVGVVFYTLLSTVISWLNALAKLDIMMIQTSFIQALTERDNKR